MLKVAIIVLGLGLTSSTSVAEELLADPTKPSSKVSILGNVEAATEYRVSSLITGKTVNLAIINNKRVKTGDLVDGAKVIGINREGVRLLVRGEQKFISLAERKGFSKKQSFK